MQVSVRLGTDEYRIDMAGAIDISRPLAFSRDGVPARQPSAFHLSPAYARAVEAGAFVGDVRRGGSCQCDVLTLTPHGNGTHTECRRHVTGEGPTVRDAAGEGLFDAWLVSVVPETDGTDAVVTLAGLEPHVSELSTALVIRTLPNESTKIFEAYSGQNPPYLSSDAAGWLRQRGVRHLVLDLPSADREADGGRLAAHRAFFGERTDATITELAYVPPAARDGRYLLNLGVAPFELDAAPSRPVLYRLQQVGA